MIKRVVLALLLVSATAGARPAHTPIELFNQIREYEIHTDGSDRRRFLSFFTPSLRRLIELDSQGGEVGVLDGDPFCDCQDNEGLTMRMLSVRVVGSRAEMKIENRFSERAPSDRQNTITLSLQNFGGDWRVADVSEDETPSLAAGLRRSARGNGGLGK